MLFRIRNPWGTAKGEWTGPWSDNSQEWENVSDTLKNHLKVTGFAPDRFVNGHIHKQFYKRVRKDLCRITRSYIIYIINDDFSCV